MTALDPAVYDVLVDELRREDAARAAPAEADDADPFDDPVDE